MNELLDKQEKLHASGSNLLKEVLMPILEKYGKVSVGGSFAYKLLAYPDLDIDIVSENATKEMFATLSAELISLEYTSKFQSVDRVNFKGRQTRVVGYWISPDINYNGFVWNLDIWFQKPEFYTGNTNKYKKELLELSDEKRMTILSLKEELIDSKLYGVGKEFVSIDVYEGVLRGNVKTVDELLAFISTSSQTPS